MILPATVPQHSGSWFTQFAGIHGLSLMKVFEVAYLSRRLYATGGNLLEIGTASGATAAAMLLANPQAFATCVDKYVDGNSEIVAESAEIRLTNWRKNRLVTRQRMSLIVGDAYEHLTPEVFSNHKMILLDADHEFRPVLRDLMNLWFMAYCWIREAKQSVTKLPIIVAHDYLSQAWPDVKKAVTELTKLRYFILPGRAKGVRCLPFFKKVGTCGSLVELRFANVSAIQLEGLKVFATRFFEGETTLFTCDGE